MSEKNFITILGVGNILLKDEGFGVHFARWFSERYQLPKDVQAIDGGTRGYALLDIICSCEHLIVIDVIKTKDTPGSIYRFDKEEMRIHMPAPTSAHEVEFFDVLFQADLLDESPDVIFLCIVPKDYGDMDLKMNSIMQEKFSTMESLLLKELAHYKIVPKRIEHA
jgi:hydrogenase maturation protease